jgi:hypothetical protein
VVGAALSCSHENLVVLEMVLVEASIPLLQPRPLTLQPPFEQVQPVGAVRRRELTCNVIRDGDSAWMEKSSYYMEGRAYFVTAAQ